MSGADLPGDKVDESFADGISLPVRGTDVVDRLSVVMGDAPGADGRVVVDGADATSVQPGLAVDGGVAGDGVRRLLTRAPAWPAGEAGTAAASAKLGYTREDVLLASGYMHVLRLAAEAGVRHLALPPLGLAGESAFPPERGARIAIGHVLGYFLARPTPALPERVTLLCEDETSAAALREAVQTRDRWMLNRTRV